MRGPEVGGAKIAAPACRMRKSRPPCSRLGYPPSQAEIETSLKGVGLPEQYAACKWCRNLPEGVAHLALQKRTPGRMGEGGIGTGQGWSCPEAALARENMA